MYNTFEMARRISILTRVDKVTELAMNKGAKSGSSSRASCEAAVRNATDEATESIRPSRKGGP
jgi:hypothetical protein